MTSMSLSTAASGMMAQQFNIDVISNDIANANTTAFKEHRALFSDMMYIEKNRVGTYSSENGTVIPNGVSVGTGVLVTGVNRLDNQGTLSETGGDFDFAIDGDGYFIVELPNGERRYTRSGSFSKDQRGEIVTQDGYRVVPGIQIPENATSFNVNIDGEAQVTIEGQIEPIVLGRFEMARFINDNGLRDIGKGLFAETISSGPPMIEVPNVDGLGRIYQRKLENSNVNITMMLVEMIKAQRTYETNSKVLQASSEILKKVNDTQI